MWSNLLNRPIHRFFALSVDIFGFPSEYVQKDKIHFKCSKIMLQMVFCYIIVDKVKYGSCGATESCVSHQFLFLELPKSIYLREGDPNVIFTTVCQSRLTRIVREITKNKIKFGRGKIPLLWGAEKKRKTSWWNS